jgi:hypothetical protein
MVEAQFGPYYDAIVKVLFCKGKKKAEKLIAFQKIRREYTRHLVMHDEHE